LALLGAGKYGVAQSERGQGRDDRMSDGVRCMAVWRSLFTVRSMMRNENDARGQRALADSDVDAAICDAMTACAQRAARFV
jgi:hypothetical protein